MPMLNQAIMNATATGRLKTVPSAAPRKVANMPLAMPATRLPSIPFKGTATTTVSAAALVEPVCKAICAAHDLWRRQAFFSGITINGPTASGGTLEGPALGPLILSAMGPALGGQPSAQRYATAIANALGEAWKEYQHSFSIPGLPWYPSFVAFPGPQAPPTPNVPSPLSVCSSNRSAITAALLADRLKKAFGTPEPDSAAFFDAIAGAFEMAVTTWVSAQQITNVLGKGPVPTFAPPYVPVGPVVGGDNIASPGHLAS